MFMNFQRFLVDRYAEADASPASTSACLSRHDPYQFHPLKEHMPLTYSPKSSPASLVSLFDPATQFLTISPPA